jgi:hypothetical protein
MDIQKWQDHVIHTVKTYGLQSPNASIDCEFQEEVKIDKGGRKKRTNMVLEICFDDLNHQQSWHVKTDRSYVQGDGVSCGPIACLNLMEIYGFLEEGSIARIRESSQGYRPIVMGFNDCVRRYNKDLKVEVHTNQFNTNQETAAKGNGVAELVSQNATESDVDKQVLAVVSAAELASVSRAIAISKRNKKQEASALKEMRVVKMQLLSWVQNRAQWLPSR